MPSWAGAGQRDHRRNRRLQQPGDGGNGAHRRTPAGVHGPQHQKASHNARDHRHDARVLHDGRAVVVPHSHPTTVPICPANSTTITPSTSSNAPGTMMSATTS